MIVCRYHTARVVNENGILIIVEWHHYHQDHYVPQHGWWALGIVFFSVHHNQDRTNGVELSFLFFLRLGYWYGTETMRTMSHERPAALAPHQHQDKQVLLFSFIPFTNLFWICSLGLNFADRLLYTKLEWEPRHDDGHDPAPSTLDCVTSASTLPSIASHNGNISHDDGHTQFFILFWGRIIPSRLAHRRQLTSGLQPWGFISNPCTETVHI